MDMMNPSVMVSRLDLVVLDLAVAGIEFVDSPSGHNPHGRAWGPRCALVGCAHPGGVPHRLFAL